MNQQIFSTLGQNLQRYRTAKGLSLSQLAQNTGIAKSNLSRIEQGGGNPTLDTIWKLAIQLDVPFGSLVASINTPLGHDGVQVKLIEQGTGVPQVDAYWMSCAPNTVRQSEAHSIGSTETVMVISGQLEAGNNGATQILKPGDSITFPADKPHIFKTTDLWSTHIVTVTYAPKEQKA